jgi:hypothetical protein
VPGSTLSGAYVTFSWSAGTQATAYTLLAGSSLGSANLANSGTVTTLSATLRSLPTDGSTVYVRLWSFINGAWSDYNDYSFVTGP